MPLLYMNRPYQYQPALLHQECIRHQGTQSSSPHLEYATQP
ncbi:hypothetical protein SynA15127_00814 [Synechococcus sp. A15-127]|nr:hypothetical protein SynA15127_00814 [Synechococcus sp. A15-127]